MHKTSTQILDIIREHGQSTTAKLSKEMQLTRANIRYHLNNLEEEGWISRSGTISSGSKGRQDIVFRPTHKCESRFHLSTLKMMYATLFEGKNHTEFNQNRELYVDNFMERYNILPLSGTLQQRLFALVRILNEVGYQAKWEARPEGPQISISECPYRSFILDCKRMCLVDKRLMEKILGGSSPVDILQASHGKPGSSCIFKISEHH